MSLNWNIEKVKDFKEVQTRAQWPCTDALIWATMIIGINRITESNVDEFYARVHLTEVLDGSWLTTIKGKDKGKPAYITREDVARRVGLGTNATNLSRTEFHKRRLNYFYSSRKLPTK